MGAPAKKQPPKGSTPIRATGRGGGAIIGYKIGENNPLLANDATAKDLTLRLNEKLLGNGFNPIKPKEVLAKVLERVPATFVGATESSAVSTTQGTTQNL
jgi:hypothetical protein